MLERVAYVSRAAEGVGIADAFDIIRVAHNRNSSFDLTGALVFIDGWFAQVLEGESFNVRERYARIVADPRHENLDLREQVQIEHRSFPGEWMALRNGDDLDETLRRNWDYAPGLPVEHFAGPRLHEFMLACCLTVNEAAR